jgi:hypothetical protein|tara:strand:- start:558 stop:1058 length:501 start_codon:yes stop_codon:yes gene_type:complete
MSEITYKIFHERTAENIKVEIQKLHDLLIIDNKKNLYRVDINDRNSAEIILFDNILDFKSSKISDKQLITRSEWHSFLTEKKHLNFNECLLILLGINPTLASLIEPSLYKTKLNEVGGLKENYLSLIFFQRVENHLLRERFRSNKINTDEFIKWAMDYKYLREIKI